MSEPRSEGEKISRLWKETVSAEEYARRRELEEANRRKIITGLAKCPVCGGAARAEEFGLGGYGVWVGCIQTSRCARNVVWHKEGWSLEESAREWNFYNRRPIVWLRKVKMLCERLFGRYGRAEREYRRKEKIREERRESEMRRIFGMKDLKKGRGVKEKVLFLLKGIRFWRKDEKKG